MANINKEDVSKAEEALELARHDIIAFGKLFLPCLLYTSPSPRDGLLSRMPSSA